MRIPEAPCGSGKVANVKGRGIPLLIGQFCETYPPMMDGVGRVMLAYCQTLAKMGHRCLYVAPDEPSFGGDPGCETLLYPGLRIPTERYRIGLPRLSRCFRRKAKKLSFDVIHAHSPFLAGREGRRLAKKTGAPLVATFHSKYYDDFYKITRSRIISRACVRYVLRFFRSCDEVWAVNEKTAQVLRDYGFCGDIITMPNGTNLASITEEQRENAMRRFPLREGVPVFLFAGQLDLKKNIGKILEACALLAGRRMEFQLVLVGDGPDAGRLRRYVRELDLEGKVLFTGFLEERSVIYALYERADLLVFPSLYDNAPMVVREAAAMATPALLVEDSCAAEGVTHGHNGFLCEDTVQSIAHGMEAALPLCESIGKKAQETIPIPWDTLMQQVMSRYEALCKRKAHSPA